MKAERKEGWKRWREGGREGGREGERENLPVKKDLKAVDAER
jgi:hypothetical protein